MARRQIYEYPGEILWQSRDREWYLDNDPEGINKKICHIWSHSYGRVFISILLYDKLQIIFKIEWIGFIEGKAKYMGQVNN